jgi:peptidyl-prolyl cis-trans isomerase A (cyclophilin A)
MPSFSRPTALESFTSCAATSLALVGLGLLLSACPSPPSGEKSDAKAESAPASTAGAAEPGTPGKPGTADEGADAKPALDPSCCRFCFAGSPCGDECLPAGKTCDKPEGDGCACSEDKYVAKEFPKGYQVRPGAGLIGPEVWNHNKAQGDPIEGPFTLEMAFEGAPELADASAGKLHAVLVTSMGKIECELYEDKAPLTVANFVGLARGVRPFKDPKDRRATEWKKAPYYDGTIFHRVIKDFMIQGGDPTAMGVGTPGYFIPDEFDPSLRHDGPGYLSMANRNPYDQRTQKPLYDEKTGLTVGNTGSAQFFITVRETSPLNDRHTIFGKCPGQLPIEISKVRTQTSPIRDKPFEDVVIEKIEFVRK